MHRKIKPIPPFRKGQKIYTFESGEGIFISNKGWDCERQQDMYEMDFNGRRELYSSTYCFTFRKQSRIWKLGKAKIEVFPNAFEGVRIVNCGEDTVVRWSDEEGDEDLIRKGDILIKDWRGVGIEFDNIIDKWLRRLNGEQIPLWEDIIRYSY